MKNRHSAVVRSRELLRLGDIEAAGEIAEAEISRLADQGDTVELWRARFIRAEILSMKGHTEAALRYLDSLTAPPSTELSVAMKLNRGRYRGLLGKHTEAYALLVEAASEAQEAGLSELLGEIYLEQAFVSFLRKQYTASDHEFRLALQVSEEIGEWFLRGSALWGVGKVLMIEGYHRDAIPWLEDSLEIFQSANAKLATAMVWGELGVCRLGLGDDQGALDLFLKAAEVESAAGLIRNYQVSLADIGNVYLERCEYLTALSYYQRALSLARDIKDPVSVKKWTYNINLAYARIRAQIDQQYPRPMV